MTPKLEGKLLSNVRMEEVRCLINPESACLILTGWPVGICEGHRSSMWSSLLELRLLLHRRGQHEVRVKWRDWQSSLGPVQALLCMQPDVGFVTCGSYRIDSEENRGRGLSPAAQKLIPVSGGQRFRRAYDGTTGGSIHNNRQKRSEGVFHWDKSSH